MKTINKEQAIRLLGSTKGRVFGVKFTKKDGSIRTMNCKRVVKKAIKGTSERKHPDNIIPVYSNNDQGYRSFDVDRLIEIRMNKETYRITPEVSE